MIPSQETLESVNIPAPLGGTNAIAPAASVPVTDCALSYNTVPREKGLGTRSGYSEFVTGLTGATDNTVRSLVSFSGSTAGNSRIFAVTSSGIWDVSTSTATPALSIAFPDTSGEAGYGSSTTMVTRAGHFAVFCDEQNGLYVYDERAASWAKVPTDTNQPWASSESYLAGDLVINPTVAGGSTYGVYRAQNAGTSGTGDGPTGTDTAAAVTEGEVSWIYVSAHVSSSIGPSLEDQHGGTVFNTGNMVFPMVFKNRLWFVERDTGAAWYLPANSLYGVATRFNAGMKFRAGGSLIGLFNWTRDGGAGMDDALVAVSSGGDVVIYEGSDPDSSFQVRGEYSVGAMLRGRNIATNYGGDVLVLCKRGLVSLAQVLLGQTEDAGQFATFKIGPLFQLYATQGAGWHGWSVRLMPEDNVLIVTVPVGEGQATRQLSMSMSTKGWSEYPAGEVPMFSTEVWGGTFWFGTVDGKVCKHTGWLDGVTLANPTGTGSAIQARFLAGFTNLGSPRQKKLEFCRPSFLCDAGNVGWSAEARYRFDFSEVASVAVAAATDGWDISTWDSGTFAGDYAPTQAIQGLTGMGTEFALWIRFAAITRTIFVGVDLFFRQGGAL